MQGLRSMKKIDKKNPAVLNFVEIFRNKQRLTDRYQRRRFTQKDESNNKANNGTYDQISYV